MEPLAASISPGELSGCTPVLVLQSGAWLGGGVARIKTDALRTIEKVTLGFAESHVLRCRSRVRACWIDNVPGDLFWEGVFSVETKLQCAGGELK